jgi:hypothetical protein
VADPSTNASRFHVDDVCATMDTISARRLCSSAKTSRRGEVFEEVVEERYHLSFVPCIQA